MSPQRRRPYQSPQRAAGEKPAVTDDLYSLGAVLYELLTSKPPFHSEAAGAQLGEKLPPSMSQRRVELGIVGETIPENWEETVAACLAKDPFRRPQSASEVEKRLKNSSNPIPNPQSPVRPPSTHRKWLTIAGLILILAAGSAVAFLALHRLSEPKRGNPVKEPSPTLPLFSSTLHRKRKLSVGGNTFPGSPPDAFDCSNPSELTRGTPATFPRVKSDTFPWVAQRLPRW